IGQPDVVLPIATVFHVPATGTVDYQHYFIDPGFTNDVWVRAVEVRPSNRKVVHHCNVFLHPPNAPEREEVFEVGALGSGSLTVFVPGMGPVRFPPEAAMRIPAGWKIHVVIHYTTTGQAEEDRTEIGLALCAPEQVR